MPDIRRISLSMVDGQAAGGLKTDNEIVAKHRGREAKLVVYPAMWKEPHEEGTIYVSNAYIKYAKPYAVQKILNI